MKRVAAGEFPGPIGELPDVLREPVSLWLERFSEHDPDGRDAFATAAGRRPALWRLVAASEYAAGILSREWPWFRDAVLGAVSAAAADEAPPEGDVRRRIRLSRHRRLLRILWRDVSGACPVEDTLLALSNAADDALRESAAHAAAELRDRFGVPRDAAGRELHLVVLAMGKLGGRELNFSSDVDLVFLCSGDGESDGARRLSAQEYFTREARQIVALLDESTPDGFAYRVDTRLRPFGDSGPPVVSFGALESYLVRHGRDWERYAYVKARVVDTGIPAEVADELMQEIIEPFVYRRYLDYGVFESLRDMKAMVSAQAQKRSLASNLKLGPGGIREIEFVVQSLQLLRGGSDRKLRTPELQAALERLLRTRNLEAAAAADLAEAYRFLRRMENAVQALRDRQDHEVPADAADRARVALALDYPAWPDLVRDLAHHRRNVEKRFAAVAFRGGDDGERSGAAERLATLWSGAPEAGDWEAALGAAGFTQSGELAAELAAFGQEASVRRLGATGARRLGRFVPDLLLAIRDRERPAPVLKRVLSIVERILRRSAYVALLNENPLVLRRLVDLCDRSAWLTEEIGRYPILLDELLDPRLHTASLGREEMREELTRRLDGAPAADSEQRIEILGQFQRALLFRIAVLDIAGNLPIMKVSDRLTELAEVVVETVLRIAWDDLTAGHGEPKCLRGDRRRAAGFGVIAYGKLGGMELSYRSDLDLVFLHDSADGEGRTDGDKPLDNNVFYARLVRRIVHFLTLRTPAGVLYEVDTRLRPSGRSGLLVTGLGGFERYQIENAWTWEHQALLRARPVAGSATVCREFERIRGETLKNRVRRERLREDVIEMRRRVRERLDRSEAGTFDLKQGAGGIGDIEFLVQYLVLANAGRHPAVIHYSDNIRQLGVLGAAGCLAEADAIRLQDVYKDYRLRTHHLALDEKPPRVDDGEFAEARRFVRGLWDTVMGPGSGD